MSATADLETTPLEGQGYQQPATRSFGLLRVGGSDFVIAPILAVLAWPSSTLDRVHSSGLDGWLTALTMAVQNGMQFGTHVLFTYGPLGFLTSQQLYYQSTALAAFIFAFGLSTAVFVALMRSLRRTVPAVLAILIAYGVGATILHIQFGPEYSLPLVLVACAAILSRQGDEPGPIWVWVALGGALSLFALVKLSLGVGIVAVLAITVVFLPGARARAVGGLAVGAVPVFLVSWFGTGNGVGNVLSFVKGSAAIVSGYSSAMSIEDPTRGYTYGLAAFVVIVIGGFSAVYVRRLPLRSGVGIGLATLVTVWLLFKEGFVRHDYHDLIFFAAAPLILLAFVPWKRAWTLVPGVVVLTVVTVIVGASTRSPFIRPDVAARNFFSEAATLVSPGRSAAVVAETRRSLRAHFAFPATILTKIQGQTVDVSPWEQTIPWAYPQVRFDPLPVITDYNAYTPSLDQLDADYVKSTEAPRFILRQPLAIDGRDPAFEPPATELAVECFYRQVARVGTSWQLLERGADRCGPPRLVGSVATGFGHWVSVPIPPVGYAVVARFELSQGWISGVEALIFKPPEVVLAYSDARPAWRFIASTAPDPHMIRPASTLGYSKAFTPTPLERLRFSIPGRSQTSTGVRVLFYEIREAAPASGASG